MSDRPPRPETAGRSGAALLSLIGSAALVALNASTLTASSWSQAWQDDPWTRPVLLVHLASSVTAVAAGIWILWRRPSNRCGPVAVGLGIAFTAWWWTYFRDLRHGWWAVTSFALVIALRPLLFWLVLAFPVGRLDRAGRLVLAVLTAGASASFIVTTLTRTASDDWPAELGQWDESAWTLLVSSAWWDVGALFGAAAVLVVVQRRRLRFRTFGDHAGTTVWWAAAVATGADFVLLGQGPLRALQHSDHGLTPYGMAVQVIDLARWGLVVMLIAWAARRAWPRDRAAVAAVDIDDAGVDDSLRAALARALGDPGADVAVHDARSGWIDLSGRARSAPDRDLGATVVMHNGAPLAALEYDGSLALHPSIIDTTVAALALQLKCERQLALARNYEAELRQLGRDLVDAEDRARRVLERDLHDGAQQALIGLGLQAALADRKGATRADEVEIADAIDDSADALAAIARGRPPALLAERGLDGALAALVLTSGLRVRADICRSEGIPNETQRAVWFAAAEAVTNTLKHAAATELHITLRMDFHEVHLVIADDGVGGVSGPPRTLAERVSESGGRLDCESTAAGTTIVATFPIEVMASS